MKARLILIAATALAVLPAVAQGQIFLAGNDEKVWWDDSGKPIAQAPGKDTVSFVDIGDRANPKIIASIQVENSIFGPPTILQVHPSGEIALVANSVTQTKDGDNWKP